MSYVFRIARAGGLWVGLLNNHLVGEPSISDYTVMSACSTYCYTHGLESRLTWHRTPNGERTATTYAL